MRADNRRAALIEVRETAVSRFGFRELSIADELHGKLGCERCTMQFTATTTNGERDALSHTGGFRLDHAGGIKQHDQTRRDILAREFMQQPRCIRWGTTADVVPHVEQTHRCRRGRPAPERDELYAGDAWRSNLDLLARSSAAPKLNLTAGNA